MSNRNIPVLAIISLALLLTSNVFGQEKGKGAGANNHGKSNKARYANQEVSYRTQAGNNTSTTGQQPNAPLGFDKGYLTPYARSPKQLSLLPYMEQSNLRSKGQQTSATTHAGTQRKRKTNATK